MGSIRRKNILNMFDIKFLVAIGIAVVLFLIFDTSTHNISLEDCDECKAV